MGYDIALVHRGTNETVILKDSFYKRGSNVRVAKNEYGYLEPIKEAEADLAITSNYSKYYYEATEGDERFLDEEGKNGGLRGLDGKSVGESILMIGDMLTRIQKKYCVDGKWLETERTKTKYFDKHGNEVDFLDVWNQGIELTKKDITYTVSEGDTSDYWESTAANAMTALTQLSMMAMDCIFVDCQWKVWC